MVLIYMWFICYRLEQPFVSGVIWNMKSYPVSYTHLDVYKRQDVDYAIKVPRPSQTGYNF